MVYDDNPRCEGGNANYVRRDQGGARQLRTRVKHLPKNDTEEAARYSADQDDIPHLFRRKMHQHGTPEG